ncbi:Gfo/Idh/MocA family oxidoreductase [Actinophytocola sp.]|uniref:Gfo/Idh/MocA family protein n=1 Tax=Actinophytocola sp. TaxID=1872138 RepID=UPI002D80482E|nr:Gfo/Idh/MocA family oxidoreductase [Actinophytocola sp.]HET9138244.1 Gfo/Idh/MocA family oxidoreductase [Actinophytocola sp.]
MSDNAAKRVVLVGAGSMGALHARVLSQSPRVDLVRIVEPREEAGRAVAERFDTRWTPEIDSLAGVDAVVLASATATHHKLALDVLNQDVALLVEKPVCDDLTAAEEVVALAKSRDVPLMCGLLERYNPAVVTALSVLDAPVHVTATRHSPYAPRIKTGVGWDLLVHDVDLAIRCFGGNEPVRVSSGTGYFHPDSVSGAEDVLDTVLGFGEGGLATVSASRVGQRKVRTLSITEVNRLVEIDLLRRDVTIYRHVSHDTTPDGLGYRQQTVIDIPELVTNREPLAAQLDRFLDLVEGVADPAEELASILPAHRVVARVLDQAAAPA